MDLAVNLRPDLPRLTDGERLWSDLMAMAKIGALAHGGCCRLSLTDEDRQARDLFVRWAREAGCEVRVDPFGNIFATRAGRSADAAHVLVGSHLDTQPHGGRFDGVLGVLAGLEVVRALNAAGIETEHAVTVVNWTNEEGVRFSPGLTGSGGFVGAIRAYDTAAVTGVDGVPFYPELHRIGYGGAARLTSRLAGYYELHIEQGPVLEGAGATIGIVEGIQGVRWLAVELAGEDRHAGTTPAADRRDAFMAAARLAIDARAAALALDRDFRITFGRVGVEPGSINTVPGRVTMSVDLRHSDVDLLDRVEKEIVEAVAALAGSEGTRGTVTRAMDVAPVRFDAAMQDNIEASASGLGIASQRLPSGAMHDASNLARIAPSAMIFVPSRGGISHNESEWTDPAQVADGCEVLARAVLRHATGKLVPH
ncbi:Zn-dependent hydrolase [Ancylobacter oerskovii]|uniref:Zn-dependent hydrolase n=1 Tax=Ancylobacter oerskovii TaxID=459519 RepID=A0ABW4Z0Y9_9HYPH|nr:Zn-dependent hydrolase [Ancylobacter oerskovii]MBS7542916.1 Zn-dependent hydrolase [Ancylobacter oerskovii]